MWTFPWEKTKPKSSSLRVAAKARVCSNTSLFRRFKMSGAPLSWCISRVSIHWSKYVYTKPCCFRWRVHGKGREDLMLKNLHLVSHIETRLHPHAVIRIVKDKDGFERTQQWHKFTSNHFGARTRISLLLSTPFFEYSALLPPLQNTSFFFCSSSKELLSKGFKVTAAMFPSDQHFLP